MNIADVAIRNRSTTLVLTVLLLFRGIASFGSLARLEDPEFTIKEALVVTPYPGATAAQVEEEVSDKIEQAVQQLGQLKEVESKSDRGLSTVTVRIKDKYDKFALPQVWDELRRKVWHRGRRRDRRVAAYGGATAVNRGRGTSTSGSSRSDVRLLSPSDPPDRR